MINIAEILKNNIKEELIASKEGMKCAFGIVQKCL